MKEKENLTAKKLLEISEWYQAGKLDGNKMIKKVIKEHQNPYPNDIFLWDNKEKLNFNRGRFNQFIFEVVENTKDSILKEIQEEFENDYGL